jgi:hydroxyacylglutathione hydrolase
MLRLINDLWVVSGEGLTHPWDASAYLIKGDEPALIDCGSALGYPALKRSLHEAGLEPRDIVRVIGTHGHWDHISGMAQLRAESAATLHMHPADREQVETGDFELTSAFLYDQPFPPVAVDGLLEDGDILQINDFIFTVIHTPGHTPGSISLWTDVGGIKLLIAADTITGGYSPRIRSDLEAWAHSLDRLLELDFDVMTLGHCPPQLILDAKERTRYLRSCFGRYFDPWFQLRSAG